MKRLLFLLLCGTISGACSSDGGDAFPVLVRDVVMPPADRVFEPGDEVTVAAEGFEADDEILFEIRWTAGSESFAPNGYAKGVWGIVAGRTSASITFLAPGHYPASTVEVLLRRGGRMMPLGAIRVADGELKAAALYGIAHPDGGPAAIDRIDPATGAVTRVATLGAGQGVACPVNVSGSGWICGVWSGSMTGYDLTMRRYADFGYRNSLFAGLVADRSVALLSYFPDTERLVLDVQTETRTSAVVPVSWEMPEETVRAWTVQPFVMIGPLLLLTQRNPDGTCSPMLLSVSGLAKCCEPVAADAMVPFWTVTASSSDPERFERIGGYAVAAGGRTQLRTFDFATLDFGRTLAEVPGTVLSVAEYASDGDSIVICLLCETDGERRIHLYDLSDHSLRTLPGTFGCDAIVVAK